MVPRIRPRQHHSPAALTNNLRSHCWFPQRINKADSGALLEPSRYTTPSAISSLLLKARLVTFSPDQQGGSGGDSLNRMSGRAQLDEIFAVLSNKSTT